MGSGTSKSTKPSSAPSTRQPQHQQQQRLPGSAVPPKGLPVKQTAPNAANVTNGQERAQNAPNGNGQTDTQLKEPAKPPTNVSTTNASQTRPDSEARVGSKQTRSKRY